MAYKKERGKMKLYKMGGAGFIVISWSFDLVPTSQWILKLSKMAIFIKASIKESKKKERWRTWIHFETLFKL